MPGDRGRRIAYRRVGNQGAAAAGETRAVPAVIQSDNGPEFRGRVMDESAYRHGVRLQLIEPGKPIQNAFVESFNSRLREEGLNEQLFVSLDDARRKIEESRLPDAGGVRGIDKEASPPRAPLGPRTESWPARCNALRPRIQNPIVFRPPSDHEGRLENLDKEI
jgi:transposase InsO family protein